MTQSLFSATQLEAAKRLCAATFTRRPRYNQFLFKGGPVRTFLVRTCMPATDKLYSRTLRLDPCSYCGSTGRSQLGYIFSVPHVSHRREKKDLLNMTAVCTSCNTHKRTPLLRFMLEQVEEPHSEESTRDLLCAVIELTEKRGSRTTIATLARRALEVFDRDSEMNPIQPQRRTE